MADIIYPQDLAPSIDTTLDRVEKEVKAKEESKDKPKHEPTLAEIRAYGIEKGYIAPRWRVATYVAPIATLITAGSAYAASKISFDSSVSANTMPILYGLWAVTCAGVTAICYEGAHIANKISSYIRRTKQK